MLHPVDSTWPQDLSVRPDSLYFWPPTRQQQQERTADYLAALASALTEQVWLEPLQLAPTEPALDTPEYQECADPESDVA